MPGGKYKFNQGRKGSGRGNKSISRRRSRGGRGGRNNRNPFNCDCHNSCYVGFDCISVTQSYPNPGGYPIGCYIGNADDWTPNWDLYLGPFCLTGDIGPGNLPDNTTYCHTNSDCRGTQVCRNGRCVRPTSPTYNPYENAQDVNTCDEWYGVGCGLTAGPFENGNTTSCAPTAMLIRRDCNGNSPGCWNACINNQEDSNCPTCNWNCDGADSWGC